MSFGAWVRAASVHESPEHMGVSHLLEHMVFKGTERRSSKQIALELEALGGSLDAYTSREHTVYQARVLDEHLPIAADVIADIVFRPLLRSSDLTLERKVVLEEIAMHEDTPDDIVFDVFHETIWPDHPLGRRVQGLPGTVEQMSLRMTVLRDDTGALHSIPNSEIKIVSNMTRDWAQVALHVSIDYSESSDRVIHLLKEVGADLQNDQEFGNDIVGHPEVPGIERVSGSEVDYLMVVKCRPGRQHAVRRELRKRIKTCLEKNGIKAGAPNRMYVMEAPPVAQ